MNDKEIFEAYIKGANPKDFKKLKISKSKAYKINSRFILWKEITEPIMFMCLNLSEREFRAVRDNRVKKLTSSKSSKNSFSHPPIKLKNKVDEEDDIYD